MVEKVKHKKITHTRLIISVVGLVATTVIIFVAVNSIKKQQDINSPPPTQTQPIQAITALGKIEPVGEVIQLAAPPNMGGNAKIVELLVKVGDTVEEGAIIAILDNHNLQKAAVAKAEQDIKVAEANLAIVKAGAKTGEIKAQQAIIEGLKAKLSGTIASNQAKIARLEVELVGEEKALTATIERLQAELTNAEREFQRYQSLAQDGAISDSELDSRRMTKETAQEKVKEAQANLEKILASLAEEIKEAKAIANQEEITLNQDILEAEATLDKIKEVRYVEVALAQQQVNQAIAVYQQAEEDLELTYVKAPVTSQVLEINARPGEIVDPDSGIVELGQTQQMIVVAEIYESDIAQVSLGQEAVITSESGAFEGKITGKVGEIGKKIGKKDVLDTDPAADVDSRVVEVKIFLNPEDSNLVDHLTYSQVLVNIRL